MKMRHGTNWWIVASADEIERKPDRDVKSSGINIKYIERGASQPKGGTETRTRTWSLLGNKYQR